MWLQENPYSSSYRPPRPKTNQGSSSFSYIFGFSSHAHMYRRRAHHAHIYKMREERNANEEQVCPLVIELLFSLVSILWDTMFEKCRIIEVIRAIVRPLHANLVKTRQTGSQLPNTSDGGDKLRVACISPNEWHDENHPCTTDRRVNFNR
jgi:hypothetical protein